MRLPTLNFIASFIWLVGAIIFFNAHAKPKAQPALSNCDFVYQSVAVECGEADALTNGAKNINLCESLAVTAMKACTGEARGIALPGDSTDEQ